MVRWRSVRNRLQGQHRAWDRQDHDGACRMISYGISWRFPGCGVLFPFSGYFLPFSVTFNPKLMLKRAGASKRLVRPTCLEAVAAIDWSGTARLERNLRLHTAAGADGIVQLARTATAATISASATAAATSRFRRIPAGFAFFRLRKSLRVVEFLLFISKGEGSTAGSARNVSVHCCLFTPHSVEQSLLAPSQDADARSSRSDSHPVSHPTLEILPSIIRPSRG